MNSQTSCHNGINTSDDGEIINTKDILSISLVTENNGDNDMYIVFIQLNQKEYMKTFTSKKKADICIKYYQEKIDIYKALKEL